MWCARFGDYTEHTKFEDADRSAQNRFRSMASAAIAVIRDELTCQNDAMLKAVESAVERRIFNGIDGPYLANEAPEEIIAAMLAASPLNPDGDKA